MISLLELLRSRGFFCTPIFDGEYHRFDRNGKVLAGWFKGRVIQGPKGEVQVAEFGDWATSEKHEWRSDAEATYSPEELAKLNAEMARAAEEEATKKLVAQTRAADLAVRIWEAASPAPHDHPYLVKKGIEPGPARLSPSGELLLPVYVDGFLASLQFINQQGSKQFLSGGKLKGGYFLIDGSEDRFLAEGFATAMSVHQATGASVYVAFNAGNLVAVAADLKAHNINYLTIAADNDLKTPGNPGRAKAMEAAAAFGVGAVVRGPSFPKDAEHATDWNDFHLLYGLEALKNELTGDVSQKAPAGDTVAEPVAESAKPKAPKKEGFAEGAPKLEPKPPSKAGLPPLSDFVPLPPFFAGGKPVPPPQFLVVQALQAELQNSLLREGRTVFSWQGTHWTEEDPDNFKFYVKQAAQRLRGGGAKEGETNDIYSMLLTHLPATRHSFFTQSPTLANFLDGTLEVTRLKGGEYRSAFREHRRTDLCTWVLPYRYKDPRPENRLFAEWLTRCFEGDPDAKGKIRALAQIGGASLISLFPRTAFLHGVAGTGKSTFAKLCLSFIGKGNYSSVEPKDQDGFLKETMINKQANVVTDISAAKFDPALIKRYEDRVPELVNRKNRQAVHAYLPALHIYCANKLPRGIDQSDAFDRRVTIVQFNNVVTKGSYERDYETVILEQGPGAILDFFEKGLIDLLEQKGIYFNPESGKAALQKWKDSESVVAQFLDAVAHGEIGPPQARAFICPTAWAARTELALLFDSFCPRSNSNQARHAFFVDLEARGFVRRKRDGVRGFMGIGITGRDPGTDDPQGTDEGHTERHPTDSF